VVELVRLGDDVGDDLTDLSEGVMTKDSKEVEATKNLMGALVRMKPKPHEEMKVGKKVARSKRVAKTTKNKK
jgi:hypothetical protein